MQAIKQTSLETFSEPPFKEHPVQRRTALINGIKQATQLIPLIWPMQTFIASNPLRDLETKPFLEAIDEALAYYHHPHLQTEATQTVNRLLIKWSQLFFDQGQAAFRCFDPQDDFYTAWRQNQPFDSETSDIDIPPNDPVEAIDQVLTSLSIAQEDWESFFKLQLAALPGWGGWIKRLDQWEEASSSATIIQLLAVRLTLVSHFDGVSPHLKHLVSFKSVKEEIDQAEETFLEKTLNPIENGQATTLTDPEAQWIFCIDTRSEPLRRHLEQTAPFETFGYAGFFGIPLALKPRGAKEPRPACPIILKPQFTITEKRGNKTFSQLSRKETFLQSLSHLFLTFKKNLWTPFALVETLGLFSGMSSLCATLLPKKLKSLQKNLTHQSDCRFTHSDEEIDVKAATSSAEGFLKSIGLVQNFAPHVILCGHGSHTTNNPHSSALQCGACGGNEGGSNAQVMSGILNDSRVRAKLQAKGITIPPNTRFVAALHETTTDTIQFYDPVPSKLIKSSQQATSKTQEEKKQYLDLEINGTPLSQHLEKKGASWSETRPEWGLVRNAGFVVAPRSRTRNLSLEGRCFLHSYDYHRDPDGTILQGIFGGPVTVAHWINMQYLFSTLCPELFGGGSKVTHNITGRFGLMQGNSSDLMHGLPLQSLYFDDDKAHHTPARLHLVVEAPQEHVEKALAACPSLQEALTNEWLHLKVLTPP